VHVDLCGVRDLLSVDREQDGLKAEAKALAAGLNSARAVHADAEAALVAAQETRAAAVKEERRLNRKLEDYISKRDRTRTLIDSGGAPDYATATKQLNQLIEIVDELEYSLLEQMEARELSERGEARAERVVAVAAEGVEQARQAQRTRRPEIEARFGVLRGERTERWAALRGDEQSHYAGLRKRGTPVLVDVDGGVCSHCHVEPPPQTVVEVLRDRRVHTCRNCHCWFRQVRADRGEE
jgi:predicted  nucleic acid-binding Zn-ribbon protein